MGEDDLADLRRLLREGQITPERFRRLSGGASADLSGSGAIAQGDGASAIGERAVEARDLYGQIRTGDEYHLHVGGTDPDLFAPIEF